MLVCVDTHVLIWGVQGVSRPNQSDMIPKTWCLLRDIDKAGDRILVPTPAIWEYLLGIDNEEHGNVISTFQQRFRIAPFDVKAAHIAARLWKNKMEGALDRDEWVACSGRQKLKIDCQIVAIAVACDAKIIYSEDPDIIRYSKDVIQVQPIPPIMEQVELSI